MTSHSSVPASRYIRAWLKHIFQLCFGLALFAVLLYFGDLGSLRRLTRLRWLPLLGVFFATLGIASTVASRWGSITNVLAGRRVAPWYEYLHHFLLSRFLGFILPKDLTDLGGRTAALYHFHAVPLTLAGVSVLLDRLFDVLSVVLFVLPALLYWTGWVSSPVAIGLMFGLVAVAGGLLFVGHGPLVASITWLLSRSLQMAHRLPWLQKRLSKLRSVAGLDRDLILRVYLFSLAKFCCTACRLLLLTMTLSLPISPILILLSAPLGQLTYLFAFTPGGLGIFEAGWFAILKLGGVATEYATIFVVGRRVLTAMSVGILALLSQMLHMCRRYFSQSARDVNHSQR
jgi:uncharacterized protein (TIRG00374 family)